MEPITLIVPGFRGSGPAHWQSWLEARLPGACRVAGIDWEAPVLARWAAEVRREIDAAPSAVWLVAHSFGCLAAVVAAADRPDKVAGALLVAPADPERFASGGRRDGPQAGADEGIAAWLPQSQLGFPSAVVASSNDPWVELKVAAFWAERWGTRLVNLGPAGHINVESGYGPWPQGLELLLELRRAQDDLPLGAIGERSATPRSGRQGALARIRHGTRRNLALENGRAS
jgi:predicted alpha/beta hydrolase family esterase